jgi:hypothetical protein
MLNDSELIHDNRDVGPLYDTDKIHILAVLIVAGHKVRKYTTDRNGRLVAWFPIQGEDGQTVHDTILRYGNHDLPLDARAVIDTWMHCRDMTRNKRFIVRDGPAKA